MAKYSSSINYKITTSLDASGITKLQAELNKLEHELGVLNKRPLIGDAQTQEAIRDIQRIQNALKQAFNPKLGMVNSRVLMNELTKGGRSLADIYNTVGKQSTSAMAQLYGQLARVDTGMKSISKTTDKVFNTLGNTVRWGVIASGFQYVLNSAHGAVQYMADLDKSLTNIRLVTDESKESMREFAQYANDAAKSLGNTTVAYTDAALIYAQQGYGLQDQKTLANYTLMTANATGQDTAEVSEQMTALINGFQLSVEDVGSALDVMAKVANTSAADLEELATAASKVASTANTLGVTQEQLTAQIATIVSVTREAPENVGNALKTIYARFGDLSLGETLEDGTDLGKVSSTLQKIGVQVLDSSGAMRDMGLIMEDLMAVWDTLDTATKQGAAVTLAGKYQYNRLMALMENSDMYEGYYDDAINSAGTLEEMQAEKMEGLEAKANVLKASFESLLSDLFNQDDFGVVLEGLTEIIDKFDELIEAIGGGGAALTAFGAIGMNVFSNQIGRGISNVISNKQKASLAAQNIDLAASQSKAGMLAAGVADGSERMQNFGKDLDKIRDYAPIMNDEQLEAMNQKIKEYEQSIIKADQAQKEFEYSLTGVKAAFAELGIATDGTTEDLIAMLQKFEAGDAKLEDLENTLGGLSSKMTNTQMAITNLSNSLAKLDLSPGADNDETLLWEKIIRESDRLKINLEELLPTFNKLGLTDKEIKGLETVIKQLGDTTDGVAIDFNKLAKQLSETGLKVDDFRYALEWAIEKGELTSQMLEELRQKYKAAAFAADGTRESVLGMTEALSNQAIASNIANVASGLMSVAFAIQSLQSLGSIWANDDLELSEKLSQTLMNTVMTVSMLAMAYVEMTNAIEAFKTATTASTVVEGLRVALRQKEIEKTALLAVEERKLAIARGENVKALTLEAAREQAVIAAKGKEITLNEVLARTTNKLGTYIEKAGTGLEKFFGVLKKVPKPLWAIAAAVAAGSMAYGAYQKQVEETAKQTEEALQKSNEEVANIQSLRDALEPLYEEYLNTGNATEDFKTALVDLGEALGISDAQILTYAGSYEYLKGKIDEATASQILYNAEASRAEATSTYQEGKIALVEKWGWLAGLMSGFLMPEGVYAEYARNAVSERDSLLESNAALRSQQGAFSEDDTQWQEIQKQIDTNQRRINELDSQFKINGYETYLNHQKGALDSDFTYDLLTGAFNSYAETGDVEGLKTYLENAFGTRIKDIVGDNPKKQEEIIFDFLTQIAGHYENEGLTNGITAMALQTGFSDYLSESGVQEDSIPGIIEQINAIAESLPDDEKINLFNALQSSGLTGQELTNYINDIINGLNNGGTLESVLIDIEARELPKVDEYNIDENSKVDSSRLTSILEAGDMTQEQYDIYEHDFQKTFDERRRLNGQDRTRADILEDIAKQQTALKQMDKDSKGYKEAEKQLHELNEELHIYDTQLHDTAALELESSIGLGKLKEAYEGFNNATTDAEAAKAMEEMRTGLAMLLNMDASQLSTDFILTHMDKIKEAVAGSESAIEDLRAAAAQKYVIDMHIVDTPKEEVDEIKSYLASQIDEINAMDIEVGASIDDTDFIATLTNLLAQSKITTGEVNDILDRMGYDVDISYKQFDVPQIEYTGSGSIGNGLAGIFNGAVKAVTSVVSAKFPVITTRKRGPSGGSGYTPSGGSGGGGGGGGGSSYTPKTEKKSDAEADRYQDVNAHLDRLSGNLEKVANEQDRLVGKDMLDNMNEQLDILEQQVKWHQRKLEIQQQEAAELRSELGQDYGITFNSEGYMENYEAIFNKYKSEYDALVDRYNATSDEEGQEKIKEQMDEVKEKWDEFNESIERYDELVNNEILESINTLEDLENQMEDLRIEAFNMAVEAADNIKEVKDAWADYMGFMSGLDPDSPFRSLIEDAEKYENAIESVAAKQQDLDQLMQWAPQYQAGGVITSDNPFGENSAAFYEALQTAYESYIKAALAAEELYYQQIDDIMKGYDEVVDKISKRMEKYARLTEQLDHYASVIETLYGDEDYDKLLAIKRANQDVLESSIEQSKRSLQTLQAEYEKQKAAGILGEEQLEQLRQHVVEAEQELEGLVEEAAQNIMDILEMEVDSAVSKWKNAMLGGDADWMETQWELAKQNAELYLDTVEETYELEKLRSKYNSLANDTMDLNIRKRINDQMEQELSYLREKDKLSEYDINYANAKLEILQKQIALEEAQANKNQMKLRRDSQGNYSYVYSANQDDVTNAQNELMDAEFNAYNMSKENYTQTYDNYLSYVSNIAEQIRQISLNTELEEDERNERIAELKKYLAEYIASISDQLTASQRGMLESVALLAEDTSGITGETFKQISEMMQEDWTAALEAIGVATNDNFVKLMTNMESFFTDTEALWSDLEKSLKDWAERVELIADDGTKGFRNIDDVIIDINKDMKELNDETENFFGLINDDLGTIDSAIGKLADYEKQILGLKESSSQIAAQLRDARDLVIKQENDIRELQDQLTAERNKNSNPGKNSGGGGNNDASDKTRAASVATEALKIVEGVHNGTIANGSGGWRPAARKAGYSEDAISVALAAFNDSKAGGGYSYYYDKALELVKSYDTGGYTGAWGKEGRLAMLHQKELVLNAADTENILAAVSTIRDVIAAMKGDSLSSILSLGRGSNIANNTGTNVQQNIEIYADFPAAESAVEIKTALEGLAQQAVQYSMRTR